MDFIKGNIKKIYFKYLAAAFGSALISSIYGAVDMAVVGQYQGPSGTAALAVVAPVWNVIFSLGLLTGIGGSVIFSTIRGRNSADRQESNAVFTAAFIESVVFTLSIWFAFLAWDEPVLTFFGADELLMPLALEYLKPIKFMLPLFLINQFMSAFLRNDSDPTLATAAVLTGGVFNIFGDIFFVFTLDMGMAGAGLATALGGVVTFIIMVIHFFKRKNTLRLVAPKHLLRDIKRISVTGFASFFIDIAMGIVTILFNRQINRYLGTDALAVYGIIINISTFVQACAYSIGQAAQPIISVNYGACKGERIGSVLRYALVTALVLGAVWTAVTLAVPNVYVYIFMAPTAAVLEIAPSIIRTYGISFFILPVNVLSTYYFQAILKPQTSFVVSVARGAVISGVLIMLLPTVSANLIWLAMPITELVVMIYVIIYMKKYTAEILNSREEEESYA